MSLQVQCSAVESEGKMLWTHLTFSVSSCFRGVSQIESGPSVLEMNLKNKIVCSASLGWAGSADGRNSEMVWPACTIGSCIYSLPVCLRSKIFLLSIPVVVFSLTPDVRGQCGMEWIALSAQTCCFKVLHFWFVQATSSVFRCFDIQRPFTFMHLAGRFYPKRLTVHSGYTFFSVCLFPVNWNPQPFALLMQCSTTEPQEQFYSFHQSPNHLQCSKA